MNSKEISFSDIEKAVVTLPNKRGKGVLIKGGFVMTAAHCISCTCSGIMPNNYNNPVLVKAGGKTFRLNILFVDPISDISVLGPLDQQDFIGDYNAFSSYIKSVKPLRIAKNVFKIPFEPLPLKAFNKDRQWIDINARITNFEAHSIFFKANYQIKPGASGGPIINQFGELVSIISSVSFGSIEATGTSPIPHLTLPKWILFHIGMMRRAPINFDIHSELDNC